MLQPLYPWERPGSQCIGGNTGFRVGLLEYKYHLIMFRGLHTAKKPCVDGSNTISVVLYKHVEQFNK
jgi:hypothetical protein